MEVWILFFTVCSMFGGLKLGVSIEAQALKLYLQSEL